jgi:hypothetical protein
MAAWRQPELQKRLLLDRLGVSTAQHPQASKAEVERRRGQFCGGQSAGHQHIERPKAKPRHVVRGFAGLTRRGAVLGGSIRLI